MIKRIVLNSSEIAKITGHNKFEPIQDYIDQVLAKHGIVEKYIPKTEVEKTLLTCGKKELLSIKKELNLKNEATISDIQKKINIITSNSLTNDSETGSKAELQKKLVEKPIVSKILKGSIEKEVMMKRGNIKENVALNKSEKKLGIKIDKRNTEFYKKELFKTDKCEVILCGRVDGISSNNELVETKNRRNRLFNRVPNYEKIQMECYMFLTGIEKCIHIENYEDKTNTEVYQHDETIWEDTLYSIKEFIKNNVEIHL
jgi:hypothetical protein